MQAPPPAFLDALDTIRVWLPEPLPLDGLTAQVRQDDAPLAVARIDGAERDADDAVTIAGDLQEKLGEAAWNPAGRATRMLPAGGDVYVLTVALPAGTYAYKLTRGGSWAQNWGAGFAPGGANIALRLDMPGSVTFVADFRRKTIRDSVNVPGLTAPTTARAIGPERFRSVDVRLARPIVPADIARPLAVRLGDGPWRKVHPRDALNHPAFVYDGDDLGARWSKTATRFTLWCPLADAVTVRVGERPVAMRRGERGVWRATVPGDLHGLAYHYEIRQNGAVRVAADLYGVAATLDSRRSIVADLSRTNPPGWPAPRPFAGKRPTDAVLYELHVRDATVDPSSGVPAALRGTYLGLARKAEPFARLGITHVHLLPVQDFNRSHAKSYNWGYETTLFNVPEEQYALDQRDPLARTRELKQLIQTFQKRGVGVVLDVVYNHTVPDSGEGSAFAQTVPYYWFRTDDRGALRNESGVGNALADERPMARKFVRDSLVFWAREYRVDGFRFDLLGMFHRDSVADWTRAVRKVHPWAVLYGEPWTGGGPTHFGKGAQRGTGMAVFNDHFRNLVRGDLDGGAPGFALGGGFDRAALEKALSGSIDDFADSPAESVNYVSAHDNLTLWDKVARAVPDPALRPSAVKLAWACVLLAPGIPFLEGGGEIGRTKGGNPNTYEAGDAVNRFDWARGAGFAAMTAYLRGLVALRRAEPLLRPATRSAVRQTRRFVAAGPRTIAFTLGDRLFVALHGGLAPTKLTLPAGAWDIVVDARRAGTRPLAHASGDVALPPLSALVARR